jgi:hypothetical protein
MFALALPFNKHWKKLKIKEWICDFLKVVMDTCD